ncbi:MAG: virulence-associated E family protein, partial [Bacteroidetes bacterium]|nr:virulence-associated E family protein [Bacteroidota bacterium]
FVDVDKKGNYKNTIDNMLIVLDNDPYLKKKLALNKFEQREVALGDLPWRKLGQKDFYLCDKDDSGIRHYLEKTYDLTGIQKVQDAVALTVHKNAFHPVKDYLSSLAWDGELRIETMLIDYLGAEDSDYVRAVTRKILVAAVARIFRPGCKFDYVLVLVGKQGKGKSTIIKKLGGNWYSDSFTTVQGKEAFEQIQGVWLLEMAELAGLKKAEMETIKHFISKCEDRYRVAYGRRIENFPRQCVFFASTNDKDFLRDPTGNRRFWPVDIDETTPIKNIFEELDHYEVDQIWAEAVKLFNAGETLYLSAELEQLAFAKQTEHSETDDRSGLVQGFLDTLLPESWPEMDYYSRRNFIAGEELGEAGTMVRQRVSIAELWCELFGKQKADMTKFNTRDLHTIMRSIIGWEESKAPVFVKGYGRQRVYRRTENLQNGIHEGQNGIHGKKVIGKQGIQEVYRNFN